MHNNHVPALAPRLTNLVKLLIRVKELLHVSVVEPLIPEWQRLFARIHQPGFTVAVAGEFSRGKSTLINRLLGIDLLPIGDLPTTAMITSIRHGPEPVLWHVRPGQPRQAHHLVPETWEAFSATEIDHEPEGTLQIELPHPWLERTRLQLLDTPGAGDLTERRTILTTQALADCDAVLVAVSATMPMSLTERAFVEEHVLARKGPRVAVVLTRLDQVPGSQRKGTVEYAREHLQGWAPAAGLWLAHAGDVAPGEAAVQVAGPDQIRQQLEVWSADESHSWLRQQQFAGQLQSLLHILRQSLTLRRQAAVASEQERQESLQASDVALQGAALGWEDLRLELQRRELAVGDWFEQEGRKAQASLCEELGYKLRRAGNPEKWGRDEILYLVRHELVKLTTALTEPLADKMEQDSNWLRIEMRKRFSWRFKLASPPVEPEFCLEEAEVEWGIPPDLRSLRAVTRIGVAVTARVLALVFPIPGIVAAAASTVLIEGALRRKTEQHQQSLAYNVALVVENAVTAGVDAVRERLRSGYHDMLEAMQHQEVLWLAARREALLEQQPSSPESLAQLDERLQQTDELLKVLAQWVKGEIP